MISRSTQNRNRSRLNRWERPTPKHPTHPKHPEPPPLPPAPEDHPLVARRVLLALGVLVPLRALLNQMERCRRVSLLDCWLPVLRWVSLCSDARFTYITDGRNSFISWLSYTFQNTHTLFIYRWPGPYRPSHQALCFALSSQMASAYYEFYRGSS